jgi:hypothetical protein
MKYITLSIFIIMLFTIPMSVSGASKSKPRNPRELSTMTQESKLYSSFRSSDGYKKLDNRFRQAWDKAITKGDFHKSFECLLKTKGKPTEGELRLLRDSGFTYRSITGQILTGNLAAVDVADVANLPFVQAMELAVQTLPK